MNDRTECIHLMAIDQCSVCMPRHRYNYAALARYDGGVPSEGISRGTVLISWELLEEGVDDAPPELGPPIKARWHGTCPGCGEAYRPGDRIHHDSELEGWACAGCALAGGIQGVGWYDFTRRRRG